MSDALSSALEGLRTAEAEAQREFDVAQLKLAQIKQAIQQLEGTMHHVDIPSQEFANMGILEASERYIREKGEPVETTELSKVLLSRGLKTKSKRLVPTVYATLTNSPKFKRKNGKWELK